MNEQWVSVNDLLPVDNMVIVYAPSLDAESPLITTAWHDRAFGWSMIVDEWIKSITHWMPMPLPPGSAGRRSIETYGVEERT